jgi:hypothetical protein
MKLVILYNLNEHQIIKYYYSSRRYIILKRILKYIGIILLCLIIPAALAFVPIGNNIILKKHTYELMNHKLNATYEILAKDDKCGKLVGNGNGMQYFSALLIHSEKNLKWENSDLEGVYLIEVNDTSFDDFMNEYDYSNYCNNIKKKIIEISNTENYYVLYSFYNAPFGSIWNDDMRAH